MHRSISGLVSLIALVGGGLVVAPVVMAVNAAPVSATTAKTITVGTLTLHKCDLGIAKRPTYCGSITVPLDYGSAKDGVITTGFGWVPALHPHGKASTIATEEGGPGYPSTGTAPDFAAMLGTKLLATHNLLMVDERGTGRSTPIDCAAMEKLHVVTTTPAFEQTVRHCGQSLNDRFPRQGGGFVHASDLFTTANGARDLRRVMGALDTGRIDLYGDSYGTYFSQSFLSQFPDQLRSVTLDSAYEASDLDPWYRTTVTTARHAFDLACDRSAACHHAAPGKSWQRITRLATTLRRHPFSGRAPGVDAHDVAVHMNITSLVNLVNDAGYDYDPYRQLDSAARAYLDHGDGTPLLRLYAQDIGYDYSDYNAAASYYSDGQYFAVGCTDYPQLFNMHDGAAKRRAEFVHAEKRYPATAFAPFTVKEWVSMDPFTETYHACTSWPRPIHHADPPVAANRIKDRKHVPVLILNGQLDSLTPAAGGAHIHRQLGSASHHVVTANTVHLVGLDDHYGCGQSLVRRFVTDPNARINQSCAPKVPTVRTVGTFGRTIATSQSVTGPGPRLMRQQADVALTAAGDAAIRYNFVDGNRDVGLRGGSIRYRASKGSAYTAELANVRWTTDSTISGHVTFSPNALRGHGVDRITSDGITLRCRFSWTGSAAILHADRHRLLAPAP